MGQLHATPSAPILERTTGRMAHPAVAAVTFPTEATVTATATPAAVMAPATTAHARGTALRALARRSLEPHADDPAE